MEGVPLEEAAATSAGALSLKTLLLDSDAAGYGAHDPQLEQQQHLAQQVQVLPASIAIIQVAAGEFHTLALSASGSVWAWGSNSNGQLGNGTAVVSCGPVCVLGPGSRLVDAVSESAALQGSLHPLDANLSEAGEAQPPAPAAATRMRQVACGARHSLAVDALGGVWAWGWNAYGQCGTGDQGTSRGHADVRAPWRLRSGVLAGVPVAAVAGGLGHSLALTEAGQVAAWGWNDAGQLGLGGEESTARSAQRDGGSSWRGQASSCPQSCGEPQWVLFPPSRHHAGPSCGSPLSDADADAEDDDVTVAKVACGARHSVALADDAALYGWGSNSSGQLGLSGCGAQLVPARLPLPPSPSSTWRCKAVSCTNGLGCGTLAGSGEDAQGHGMHSDRATHVCRRGDGHLQQGSGVASDEEAACRAADGSGRGSGASGAPGGGVARLVDIACGWSHTVLLLSRG